MRLICVRGLIPNLLDQPEWKELMHLLNGDYTPTSGDTFADKHIPHEANFVRKKQIEILRDTNNLTLTFDGNTTQKPHTIIPHMPQLQRANHTFLMVMKGLMSIITQNGSRRNFLRLAPSSPPHIHF
jgi:hypothetical protein